ncbi:uncharacterized protein LOC120354833 [Nilaparvata lugens]|uniref:uncharacterized protein LOC120354833 n=1 Tax=Nilaparvata lugens TaxID=108931 RepID=UPI00193E3EF6|nr:uncharacterized protein LOC120354833 [Nilaparvata lugens]XP_039298655.1 uncharacterized protein LOC120354833 [Nilaparvata lugens]
MSCFKCNLAVQPTAADIIKCSKCVKTYHAACTRIRTPAKLLALKDKKDTWQCEECFKPAATATSVEQDPILEAIKNLHLTVNSMDSKLDVNTKKLSELESAVNLNTSALNDIRSEFNLLKTDTENLKGECEGLKMKNQKFSEELWRTRQDLNDLQQYSRKNNLEIVGFPVTENEDIYSIIESVAKGLNLSYCRSEISIAHRIPATKNSKIPSIIVSYISRSTRNAWMAAAIEKNKIQRLNATEVNASFPSGDVYVNEHLTPQNKFLLSYGKNLVKAKKLHRAWFSNGKMWVKKNANDQQIRVWSPHDIDHAATTNE